jgi:hypothetical protein
VISIWKIIEFFNMDSCSYKLVHSNDSEELYWRYTIVTLGHTSLVGIADVYELSVVGRTEDTLESVKYYGCVDQGLAGACEGGHKELALILIHWGASDYNGGLFGACYGGYEELVMLMIRNGADKWDIGLEEACYGGHKKIALIMIRHGANDLNRGLFGACQGGHEELIEFITQKVIPSERIDWGMGLQGACRGGHMDLALRMLDKVGNNTATLQGAFSNACQGGNKELVLLLIQKMESVGLSIDWSEGLESACWGRQKELVDMLIRRGANNLEYASMIVCLSEYTELMPSILQGVSDTCLHCHQTIEDH